MNNEMMIAVAGAIRFTLKYMTIGALIFTGLCIVIGLISWREDNNK